MSTEEIFEEIQMLGLVNTLREQVSFLRQHRGPVARQTVYLAFSTPEEERTPLHRLIIREAKKLIEQVPQQ